MSYDYDATYRPLPVHDQGQEGACWHYAHSLATVAAARMHGLALGWADPDCPVWDYQSGAWHALFDGRDHTITEQGSADLKDHGQVTDLLDRAGFACLACYQPQSLSNRWTYGAGPLPVIHPEAGDQATGGHDLLVVGWTDDGLLVQNSWGDGWGLHGRAVLAWDWIDRFGIDLALEQYDTYPLYGATLPPQPLKTETQMMLARRTPTAPIWALLGGARSWVPTGAVAATQGLDVHSAKVIAATDAIWHLPVVGNLPPGGDV